MTERRKLWFWLLGTGRHLTPSAFACVVAQVAAEQAIDAQLILVKDRRRKPSAARHEVFRRLRDRGYSYPEIGRMFGLHHSTVLDGERVAIQRRARRLALLESEAA